MSKIYVNLYYQLHCDLLFTPKFTCEAASFVRAFCKDAWARTSQSVLLAYCQMKLNFHRIKLHIANQLPAF